MTNLFNDEAPGFILASKTKRFLAILIDYIILSTAYYLLAKFFGEVSSTKEDGITITLDGFPVLVLMFIWFLIMPVMESRFGQSIGKIILNIKVLKQDGTKVSLGNTTVRHLFDIVDFFPILGIVGFLVSNNNLKQRVGDLVAKTIVVEK